MEIQNVPINELKPNPENPRKISKPELNKLIRSIKEFNFVDPIIVNKHKDRYNIIIGGHQRVLAAKKIGMKTVPVNYVDLDYERENLLNIALNEISGDWDDEKLSIILKKLEENEADLSLTGFDEPFIDEIISANEEREKEELIDVAPLPPEKPISKPGELYILGNHRLLCGDATKPENWEKLMNGKKGSLCFTDPPYGVSYKGVNNPNGRNLGVMTNDELREDDLFKFLKDIYSNIEKYTLPNSGLYSCYASINHMIFEKALNESGYLIKQQLIWSKGHVLGHSDYHWSHEPILYCRKKETQPQWFGDRTHKTFIQTATIEQLEDLKKEELIELISKVRENSDILEISKDPNNEYLHSTQKPVELSRRLIKNSSRVKDIILEPCGGSGSTLIACQSSGRSCYCMEIDLKYIDVIILRYVTYTNNPGSVYRLNDDGSKTPFKEIFKGVE